MAIYQNIGQIKTDYGETAWETFFSGSEIRMFFGGPREQTTAEYVSKQAGTRTVVTAGQSVRNAGPFGTNDESDNEGQTGQPLIRPHEVCGLGPNESLIFGPRNIVINALRRPYFHTPEFAGLYDPDPMHANDATPPPPLRPETVITFADALSASEERAARARRARRPLALRMLTWGHSRNPVLNALLKVEYVLTLPARLLLALLTLPFAIHNRPIGAMTGFLAMFGFWEVFNGFAKEPIVSLYQKKSMEYQTEALAKDPQSMGDVLNSNYKAAKWLVDLPFRWLVRGLLEQPQSGGTAAVGTAGQFHNIADSQRNNSARESGNGTESTLDRAFEAASETLDKERHTIFDRATQNDGVAADEGLKEALRRAAAVVDANHRANEAAQQRLEIQNNTVK
jgi:hypothetical protein